MSYPGAVALCTCSASVLVVGAALPFMSAGLPEAERIKLPLWAWVGGLVFFLTALVGLRRADPLANEIAGAVTISGLLLAGVSLQWILDVFARKPLRLHAVTLAKALLVAPWVPLLLDRIFVASSSPGVLLLWFANGFFWQTLFGDLERMFEKERVIVRRVESPLFSPPVNDPARGALPHP